MVRLLTSTLRLAGAIVSLLLDFVRTQPRLAAIIAGVALFAIVVTSVAYFWLLVLGLLLLGFGFNLRQQGL